MSETSPNARSVGNGAKPSDNDPHASLLRLEAFAQSLLRHSSLEDLLWHIADKVGELFGFEDCVVYLVEPQGLVQYAAHGVKSPALRQILHRIVVPLGQGIVGTVAATGVAERVGDTKADPRYITDEFQGRSELAVPIAYGGRVIGVLDSESSRVDGFAAADQATFELVAMLAAPRIASALAERGMLRAEAALQRVEAEHRERDRRQHQERLESLGQLAGGIAHDFNNLLTAILGNVALASDAVGPGPVSAMLADATAACDRARGLTKQLLTFASGGAPVLKVGDLGNVAREAIAGALRGSRLLLEFRADADLAKASFDAGQMAQVFQHLAANALQATQGEGRLLVEARNVFAPEPGVEIRCHDNGPGVPEPLRVRIFDPYFTTKPGGSGLGLSTAFWIVRRHGGRLELDAGASPGACFLVRLPAAQEQAVGHPVRAGASAPARLRVLVLDDDPGVRQVIGRLLQRLGHEVLAVGDGVACVREFAEAQGRGQAFHLALLDLTLPGGMDWRETLASLRQMSPGLPAIVVSGYHDSSVLADHRRHGFAARLEKPFTLQDLRQALRQATGVAAG